MEYGEGAAGQRAVLRQGEPGPRLQILHVTDAHHEAGWSQPNHCESESELTDTLGQTEQHVGFQSAGKPQYLSVLVLLKMWFLSIGASLLYSALTFGS